jgi:hypothetical protein
MQRSPRRFFQKAIGATKVAPTEVITDKPVTYQYSVRFGRTGCHAGASWRRK